MARKKFTGIVKSAKMQKTVVVEIERRVIHPIYKKLIKKTTKLKADTNNLEIVEGNTVVIEETRPISREKYFKVIEVVKK